MLEKLTDDGIIEKIAAECGTGWTAENPINIQYILNIAYQSVCLPYIEQIKKEEREKVCQFLILSKANLLDVKKIADGGEL